MNYHITIDWLNKCVSKGMTVKEMAKAKGCSLSSIRTHLRKHKIQAPRCCRFRLKARYGYLNVINDSGERNPRGHYLVECVCECGTTKKVIRSKLVAGIIVSCGCRRVTRLKGADSPSYTGCNGITGKYWASILESSSRRLIPFEIDIDYVWHLFVQQEGRCLLSGVSIGFNKGRLQTASLDRIDSSKGYRPGNVCWLHKDINRMKQEFSVDYFRSMCRAVIENEGRWPDSNRPWPTLTSPDNKQDCS